MGVAKKQRWSYWGPAPPNPKVIKGKKYNAYAVYALGMQCALG